MIQKKESDFNIIIADTEWQTFETLSKLSKDYNLINLSSDFAVNFILDYEKVDIVILSRRISGNEEIIKKIKKKKAAFYIFGKDLKYPPDIDEVRSVIENEKRKKDNNLSREKPNVIRNYFKKFFSHNKEFCEIDDYWERVSQVDLPGFYDNESTREDVEDNSGNNLILQENDIENKLCKNELNKDLKDFNFKENKEKIQKEKEQIDSYNNTLKDNNALKDKNTENNCNLFNLSNADESNFWNEDLSVEKGKEKYEKQLDSTDEELFYSKKSKSVFRSSNLKNTIAVKQKLIVFTKAKGGVGSTFLSLFLGYEFRKLKTLLIDLNFSEGGSDIGYYLNIPKTPNIMSFVEGYNRAALDNSTVNIRDNFDLIQCPPTYELSKKLDLQDIYSLVDIARRKYHLIIFDLPNLINEIYLGVLDMADLVIMVSDFTLGSIGRLISINNRFIYNDLEKVLVMNRAKNGNGFCFTKNQLKEFFSLNDLVILNESESLSGRTDFTNLNFSNLQEFTVLTNKVLELLICD